MKTVLIIFIVLEILHLMDFLYERQIFLDKIDSLKSRVSNLERELRLCQQREHNREIPR